MMLQKLPSFDHQIMPHRYRDEKSILRVAAAVVTERV